MRIYQINSFKRTVTVRIPTGTDKYNNAKITAEFNILQRSALKDLKAAIPDEDERAIAFIDMVVKGVEGIENEDGSQMSSLDGREVVKDYPFIIKAIVDEYNASVDGSRSKN